MWRTFLRFNCVLLVLIYHTGADEHNHNVRRPSIETENFDIKTQIFLEFLPVGVA